MLPIVENYRRPWRTMLLALLLAGWLVVLSACGGNSPANSPNGFGMASSKDVSSRRVAVSAVTLSPSTIVGGAPFSTTVTLSVPAPAGGVTVRLASSDPAAAQMPATLQIEAGQMNATVAANAATASMSSAATITASYASSTAGATLSVLPPATVPFTVTVQPATVTVLQGKSGTTKITTKVSSGYSHSLALTISGDPVGVSSSANPSKIAAPGSGTSVMTANVESLTQTGSYPLTVKASDGKNSASAKLTLSVSSGTTNPNATFKGCWYKSGGHSYQAADISPGTAGTYPFNAVLYSGTSCNANDYADQFGFGQDLTLGKASYTFWFTDFKDQTNTSAIWYLGDEKSKCVNYSTAPAC